MVDIGKSGLGGRSVDNTMISIAGIVLFTFIGKEVFFFWMLKYEYKYMCFKGFVAYKLYNNLKERSVKKEQKQQKRREKKKNWKNI